MYEENEYLQELHYLVRTGKHLFDHVPNFFGKVVVGSKLYVGFKFGRITCFLEFREA